MSLSPERMAEIAAAVADAASDVRAADRLEWRGRCITTLAREDLLQVLVAAHRRIGQLTDQRDGAERELLQVKAERNGLRREMLSVAALTEIEP